ncbi:MAG: DUF4304 domain-containing protein [Agriterribacter sp.]
MITTEEFKKQIAKPFGMEMRKHGFKGTGLEYFQKTEEYLVAVYIVPGRWGGSCFAGFAIHPKQINKNSIGKLNLGRLKIHEFEFKMGLSKNAGKRKWEYSDERNINFTTLSEILEAIKQTAFPVIEKFKATPSILEKFDVSEMEKFHSNWKKRTGVSIATTDTRFAWAMAVIFENKDLLKAKQFANWVTTQSLGKETKWFGYFDSKRILKKT